MKEIDILVRLEHTNIIKYHFYENKVLIIYYMINCSEGYS